jgi:PHD/YefM family antitoxin component YafN of YafNO toxin-antitoxin module
LVRNTQLSASEARANVYRLMDQAAESHQAITGLSSQVFHAVN